MFSRNGTGRDGIGWDVKLSVNGSGSCREIGREHKLVGITWEYTVSWWDRERLGNGGNRPGNRSEILFGNSKQSGMVGNTDIYVYVAVM